MRTHRRGLGSKIELEIDHGFMGTDILNSIKNSDLITVSYVVIRFGTGLDESDLSALVEPLAFNIEF